METALRIIPYIGKNLHRFAKRISAWISNRFNIKVLPIFKTLKAKNYFLLKSKTPKALYSKVIYKFIGSYDTARHTLVSSRHLIIKVQKYLNFKSIHKSAVKNKILSCDSCSNFNFDLNNLFDIAQM